MGKLKREKYLRGFKPGGGQRKSIDAWRKIMTKSKTTKSKRKFYPLADGYTRGGANLMDRLASCFDKPPVVRTEHKKDLTGDFTAVGTNYFGPAENPIGSITIKTDSMQALVKPLSVGWGTGFFMASAHYGRFFSKLLNKEIEYLNAWKGQIRLGKLMAELFSRTENKSLRVFPDDAPQSPLGLVIFMREDAVFDLIKSNGPIVLCHPDVQTILLQWLSDKKNAHKKMSRLSSALVEYSLGSEMINTRFKPGPADIRILKTNEHEIRRAYRLFTLILGSFKKLGLKINIFKTALEEGKKEIGLSLKSYPGKTKAKASLTELNYFLFFSLVLESLEEDATLREQYESFRWQPNKLAKAIMMKALDISESKMDKALYLNKKLAPIK